MTPDQRASIKRALATPGLKEKDVKFLQDIDNSDDSYKLQPGQIKWLDDIVRRVERLTA